MQWEMFSSGAKPMHGEQADDGSYKQIVHLVQIVPTSLAARVLTFPWPLATPMSWEKILPGFFDAPGSSFVTFPGTKELIDLHGIPPPPRPLVCIVFSSVEGFKEISAIHIELSKDMLALHNACVRETLTACGGYECKEINGNFMTAFPDPCMAIEWALTLQLALLQLPWNEELLSMDQAAEVFDPSDARANSLLLRGLRSRVGVFHGPVDRVTPHGKSGRADFFGQTVNRAARLMAAAYGGQVVCERSIVDAVIAEWMKRFPPIVQEVDLKPALSLPLAARTSFPLDKSHSSEPNRTGSAKSSRQLSDSTTDVAPHLHPHASMSPQPSSHSPHHHLSSQSGTSSPSGQSKPGVRFARSFLPSASSGGHPSTR